MGMRDKYRGILYRGDHYDSIQDILDGYGIDRRDFQTIRRKLGYGIEESIDYLVEGGLVEDVLESDVVEYEGVEYKSLHALCEVLSRETGIKKGTIYARIRRGKSIDEAIGHVGRLVGGVEFPVEYRGFVYDTLGLLMSDWDVSYTTLRRYKDRGDYNVLEAVDEIVETKLRREQEKRERLERERLERVARYSGTRR